MAFAGSLIAVMLLALSSTLEARAQADVADGLQFVRLKPVNRELRQLITDGYRRSETFRRLTDDIHRSNAVVIVLYGQCASGRFRSCVTNVDSDGRQRIIRVRINTLVNDDRLIATIAHELRHVVEILADPDAMDAARTLALYRRIGEGKCRQGLSEACETKAALETERQVLDELDRAAQR